MSQELHEWRSTQRMVQIFATGALSALVITGCEKKKPQPAPPSVVAIEEVKPVDLPLSTTLIGHLDSPQNVEVKTRVEGFLNKVNFKEGSEVKMGDVLFELDKKPFLEQLSAAKGQLAEAEASLAKCEKDVERLVPLAEKKAIPQQDLDHAKASVDAAKANVDAVKARVETAQLNVGYCDITAPTTGLIGAKQVSIGELVGKGQPTLMATISTLDPIWFNANVSETEYIKAEVTSKETKRDITKLDLTLNMLDKSELAYKGKFIFMDRAIDTKTGTLLIRAEFPNTEKILRPGMSARVNVDLGTLQQAITIPEKALVVVQDKYFAWVVQDHKATQKLLKLGQKSGNVYVVKSGLQSGDQLIVEGINKVREGGPVMTQQEMAQAMKQAQANKGGEKEAAKTTNEKK